MADTPRLHSDRSPDRDGDGYRDGPTQGLERDLGAGALDDDDPAGSGVEGKVGRVAGWNVVHRWRELAFCATDHRRVLAVPGMNSSGGEAS